MCPLSSDEELKDRKSLRKNYTLGNTTAPTGCTDSPSKSKDKKK